MVGKKEKIHKRVSVPLTLEQYAIIEDAQHEAKEKSVPQFLQKFLFGESTVFGEKLQQALPAPTS